MAWGWKGSVEVLCPGLIVGALLRIQSKPGGDLENNACPKHGLATEPLPMGYPGPLGNLLSWLSPTKGPAK